MRIHILENTPDPLFLNYYIELYFSLTLFIYGSGVVRFGVIDNNEM